jgi:hypothetical protein
MAIKLAITRDDQDGTFFVWAMLDDSAFNSDPTNRGESFIVGGGDTLLDALADAEREFDRAAGELAVTLHDARLGISLGTAFTKADPS